jgi:hypothetical protein
MPERLLKAVGGQGSTAVARLCALAHTEHVDEPNVHGTGALAPARTSPADAEQLRAERSTRVARTVA